MRKPMLTNKVLRGLEMVSDRYRATDLDSWPLAEGESREDARRAREWIAAMAEWWRERHEGRKP